MIRSGCIEFDDLEGKVAAVKQIPKEYKRVIYNSIEVFIGWSSFVAISLWLAEIYDVDIQINWIDFFLIPQLIVLATFLFNYSKNFLSITIPFRINYYMVTYLQGFWAHLVLVQLPDLFNGYLLLFGFIFGMGVMKNIPRASLLALFAIINLTLPAAMMIFFDIPFDNDNQIFFLFAACYSIFFAFNNKFGHKVYLRMKDQEKNILILNRKLKEEAELEKLKSAEAEQLRVEVEKDHKEMHILKQQAEKQAEQLKDLDVQKTSFFQNISHELRTPLTLIMNPLETEAEVQPDNKNIKVAVKNSRRLLRIVNQLLDFQKIQAGKQQMDFLTLDINRLVLVCGEYFLSACGEKNILFNVKNNDDVLTAESSPLKIKGNVDALEKIIFNYLSNALKYTPKGGKIILGTESRNDCIRLYVRDSGCGISNENQKKLFQIFSQVDESTTRAYEGSGLGLALVKSLVEEMRGSVGVKSVMGEGSCFWVDFPSIDNVKSKIHLLLVEDDDILRHAMQDTLQDELDLDDHEIVGKASAEEAITFLADHDIACVVSDYNLPQKNGLDLMSEVVKQCPNAYRILMTGGNDFELVERGVNEKLIHRFFTKKGDHGLADDLSRVIMENVKYDPDTSSIDQDIDDSPLEVKSWLLPQEASVEEEDDDEVCVDGQGEIILVVDDVPDMRQLIRSTLEKYKYRVATAENGEAGLARARKIQPDLIVTDWMMPKLSGPEMIKQMVDDQHLSSVPVILLTAKNDEESRVIGAAAGVTSFLGKPFNESELVSLINNQLKIYRNKANIVRKEESDLKIELVGNLAHRINNPMHHILAIQGVMLGEIKGIKDLLTDLLSDGDEAQSVLEIFDKRIKSLEDHISGVKTSIDRSQESLQEIYSISGIEGLQIKVIDTDDFSEKINSRILDALGEQKAGYVSVKLHDDPTHKMFSNIHVLLIAFEKIIRVFEKNIDSSNKIDITGNFIASEQAMEIKVQVNQGFSCDISNEDVHIIKLLLKPYNVSIVDVGNEDSVLLLLKVPTAEGLANKKVA
ncbi:MAG: hypothetical protein CMP10_15690 [Zetaproteobacteria bacterium]|nr:hypothetical protein [Pseudobdellovibrionaceae bacterium]